MDRHVIINIFPGMQLCSSLFISYKAIDCFEVNVLITAGCLCLLYFTRAIAKNLVCNKVMSSSCLYFTEPLHVNAEIG